MASDTMRAAKTETTYAWHRTHREAKTDTHLVTSHTGSHRGEDGQYINIVTSHTVKCSNED